MSYKLKSKSSAKKRFSFTCGGKGLKLKRYAARRRHNLSTRGKKALRHSRGVVIAKHDVFKIVKKYLYRS